VVACFAPQAASTISDVAAMAVWILFICFNMSDSEIYRKNKNFFRKIFGNIEERFYLCGAIAGKT
ncbi:MAG: hypothetical protein K2F61_06555, partial [Muribaculaceae bacterium]|nr:hypothetical protein [Muribaculaceae bacterium]